MELMIQWLPEIFLAVLVWALSSRQSNRLAALEARLSHEAWERQTIKTLKLKTYIRLIATVQSYSAALVAALAAHSSSGKSEAERLAVRQKVTRARINLIRRQAVADLVLSPEALNALVPLYRPKGAAGWEYNDWSLQCETVANVEAGLLVAAKRDLGIEVDTAPPVLALPLK